MIRLDKELSEIKKSFHSPFKKHLLKEIVVWMICLVAASVGPILLINAHYKLYFITWTVVLLAVCYSLYHFVFRRITVPIILLMGAVIYYGSFVYFLSQRTSLEYFFNSLFSFRLSGDGLFTNAIIHLLWLFLILVTLQKQSASRWIPVIKSTFEYWAMIMLALFIVNTELLTNSGEGKVMILNVFLLYVFLQEVVDPEFLIKSKNKVKYLLKRV